MRLDDLVLNRRVRYLIRNMPECHPVVREGRVIVCGPGNTDEIPPERWASAGDRASFAHWVGRNWALAGDQVILSVERWAKDGVRRLRPIYLRPRAERLELTEP